MPEKDSTQLGQTENYKKMKNEIAGNKEEVAEPEEHRTEEVSETEGNVKNDRETQRVIIIARRVAAIKP